MIDFLLYGGFDNGQMDKQTDICSCRVAFATENIRNQEKLPILANF